MNLLRKLHLVSCVALAFGFLLLISAPTVRAQNSTSPVPKTENQASTDDAWHVAVTPYIWFAGLNGTVGALGHEASVHASFGDIFSYLNIGVMGAVEARHKRLVIPVDFMWIKLSDNKALPFDAGFYSVKVKMNQDMFTPKIGYRFIDGKRFKADAVWGVRYWHLGNTLSLQPTQPLGSFYAAANWIDGLAGAKFEALLTPKVVLTVLGDAGGGSARSDYQVAGLLGLRVKKNIILQAGYRYLDVDYRPQSTFVYNVAESGIMLGATIYLK
jgi:hypothetical protein